MIRIHDTIFLETRHELDKDNTVSMKENGKIPDEFYETGALSDT